MVVLVEVARKAYLASIVPVIVNAILNEHQIIVDIVAFVNRGDFPRSRLGEKQRGKILAGWVSRKMRTMAQFAIRDMAALDQDNVIGAGGGSSSGAATDANRASLSSMRSGGPGGSGGAQSSLGPPQILEQRELEQQHDEDFMYGGDGAGNRNSSVGGGGNGLPPPSFGAIEMPADDNVVLTRSSTATDGEPYAHGGDNGNGDGYGNGEGGYGGHDGGAGASGGMNSYDYDNHEYENENEVLTPTQAHVGTLAVRNVDAHADSSSDEDERPPPPIGRKPIPRKSIQSPPPGQAPPPPPQQQQQHQYQQQQQQQHEMFLPGVDGRPSMNDDWRLSTAMYSNEGGVVGAGNSNAGAGGRPVSMTDDEWAREAMRGLSLADNLDRR